MGTVNLWTDEEVLADARVKAVFDEIRFIRKSDFVNNFWRALANQPALLERTWSSIKEVMIEPGALDPLTKELIYIAVSTINGCSYCVHSHTTAARAKDLVISAFRVSRGSWHGSRNQRVGNSTPYFRQFRIFKWIVF